VAERHFPAFRTREISFQEQRRRRLREFLPHLGVQADQMGDQELDATFDTYLVHYEAAWCAYDDVVPCLRSLLDLRLAVLSNGDQAQQEDKLRRTGLAPFFEAVLTSGSLGSSKPNPEAYRRACKRLGVEPNAVMYVGDRLDVDARASSAAGLRGVWLDRATSPGSPYQPTITTLRQLPGLVAD
jgi:putative hydrolase of the HAD superfamily